MFWIPSIDHGAISALAMRPSASSRTLTATMPRGPRVKDARIPVRPNEARCPDPLIECRSPRPKPVHVHDLLHAGCETGAFRVATFELFDDVNFGQE